MTRVEEEALLDIYWEEQRVRVKQIAQELECGVFEPTKEYVMDLFAIFDTAGDGSTEPTDEQLLEKLAEKLN